MFQFFVIMQCFRCLKHFNFQKSGVGYSLSLCQECSIKEKGLHNEEKTSIN